jgi:hypothetical protein
MNLHAQQRWGANADIAANRELYEPVPDCLMLSAAGVYARNPRPALRTSHFWRLSKIVPVFSSAAGGEEQRCKTIPFWPMFGFGKPLQD